MGKADPVGRGDLPWQELLREFATIPSLLRKVSYTDRAYETTELLQDPAYLLMDQLMAEHTIVFSPPKVGGQTITATLLGHPTISQPRHVHFLSPKGLAFVEWLIEQSGSHPDRHIWYTLLAHSRWVRVLLAANRMLRAGGLGSIVPKPVLIAGVREPMAQYLSMVFQVWWMYADSPSGLTAEFIQARMIDDPWRHQCKNWFKDDLEATIGLDVFARPFPTERGWDIYENDVARVLIIRQENLDRLPESLGVLYGIDPATVKIESRNKAEEKDYSSEYSAVKKALRLSEQELEEVYSPTYVGHFYTSREIEAFKDRWRNRVGSAARLPSREGLKQEQPCTSVPKKSVAKANSQPPCERNSTSSDKPLMHHWACRPCRQCAQELQSVPILQQNCDERLKIIERVRSFWPVRLYLMCRKLARRIFQGNRAIK